MKHLRDSINRLVNANYQVEILARGAMFDDQLTPEVLLSYFTCFVEPSKTHLLSIATPNILQQSGNISLRK